MLPFSKQTPDEAENLRFKGSQILNYSNPDSTLAVVKQSRLTET
jgi:hypothetical protein